MGSVHCEVFFENEPHSCGSSRQTGVWFCCLDKDKFQPGSDSVHVASSGSLAALGAVGAVKASILQLKELVFESVFTIIPVFLALRSLLPILRVACWASCFSATEHRVQPFSVLPDFEPNTCSALLPVQWQRASICLEVMRRLRLLCRKLLG